MTEVEAIFPVAFSKSLTVECYDENQARAVFMADDGLRPLLNVIESEARNLVADPLTKDGRKQIIEMADKVKKAAKNLDKFRADMVKDLKEMPKRIDAGGKVARDFLEALSEEIRKPVTEMDAREDRLRLLADRPLILTAAPAQQLREEVKALQDMDVSEATWKESTEKAIATRDVTLSEMNKLLADRLEKDAKQVEFEEFQRKQAEEKRQKELEEARQQGIREAEARAKAEAEKKERDRIAKENAAAELKAKAEAAPARTTQSAPTNAKQEAPKATPQNASASAQPPVVTYNETYADLKSVFRSAGFADPITAIITAIKAGKIRHVTCNI